jgi:hypothetical protein
MRGSTTRKQKLLRLALGLYVASVCAMVATVVPQPARPRGLVASEENVPDALARKLARSARFAPADVTDVLDSPESFAEQDWLEHSVDGTGNQPPSLTQFATARNDWFGLLGRPAFGTGKWVPYGPTNAANDLTNIYRDRTVYTTGTENFGGRTVAGVISPDCVPEPGECTMWVATTNGGVWRTDNALAVDDPTTAEYEGPRWEFVSGTFENQSTAALELDPNDPNHKTIWAGTGEPNACSSGCEVGVGLYLSKDGRRGWRGPIGAEHFFGRGIGSIAVKPGDSNTIFVATGRATRGISNTCCGGADALIPGAPHFGLWRSQDGGKSFELVNQGAADLCTSATPDAVSLNQTACAPRGARRVKIDPIDPNTVYATFFSRGIWRSRSNGDPGTWEQIMAPLTSTALSTSERAEFDIVALANGETRMYVGVGGGVVPNPTPPPSTVALQAVFRRNDSVRTVNAAAARAAWVDLPTYSYAYCDPQCAYDNYVFAPANPLNNAAASGANADVVYLSGANQYTENNTGSGRSNGRAVLLSTDAGATFTDMTEDNRSSTYPGALHPDHHALVVNPKNWKQFFDLSDGGVNRSDGVFVNDIGDCTAPPHSFTNAARIAFCQVVLSRVPQTLNAINNGLRTIASYTVDYDRNDPERLAFGAQDNGSWETIDSKENWLQVYIADGGPNRFDATGADSEFAITASQGGALSVRYDRQKQVDVNWISDTIDDPTSVPPYANEASAFIVPARTDPVTPGWLWTGREHLFRSQNYGRNPLLATKAAHRANCNVWFGTFGDLNGNGKYDLPGDACDDWKALGNPGPDGRLTSAVYGDRAGVYISATERAYSDANTLWAATGAGRIFISKNANNPNPALVTFTRLDSLDAKAPPRYPTSIYVDRLDPNHAFISYSGYNAKTPATPGHIFEVFFTPAAGTTPAKARFVNRDGQKNNGFGDIPANRIIQTAHGTLYVATDYGVVVNTGNSGVWHMAAAGLPNVDVADLVYVPEKDSLYAATHGQGIWLLKVQ